MQEEVKWFIGGQGSPVETKKLAHVPAWKTFSKLSDEDKEKIFNAMRGELILAGRMENK